MRVRAGVGLALAALLLSTAVLPSVPAEAAPPCGLEGAGSAGDPYLVTSATDLAAVGVGACGLGASYRQTADLTLTPPTAGDGNHSPIGDLAAPFTGTYDGRGFAISGLTLVGADSVDVRPYTATFLPGLGLFGLVGPNGRITGVRVVGAQVSGPLFGSAGILVANLAGTVERSSTSGSVNAGDALDAGGLVGTTEDGAVIRYSSSTATVISGSEAGGLVAVGVGALIEDSYTRGAVTDAYSTAGGIMGYQADLGGPVQNVRIVRTFATGAVDSGILAANYAAALRAPSPSVSASFWDKDTTGAQTSLGSPDVAGLATAQMKDIATYRDAGWAIVGGIATFDPAAGRVWGIWRDDCDGIGPNDGYPFLLWETHLWADLPGAAECIAPVPAVLQPAPTLTFLLGPNGTTPLVPTGAAVWQQADGSSVPLTVSSPGPGQIRYEADGVRLTLTGGAGTGASRGLVADPSGVVECEVCVTLAGGAVIEVWMFSTPRLVAAHLADDLPCQRFVIPVVSPLDGDGSVIAGAHTLQLALPTASGMQAVNVGVTVGGPVPGSVPAGEGSTVPGWLLALGVLAVAGAARAARRQVVTG